MTQAEYRQVAGDDPLMRDVAGLCYETLHAPFGVTRDDDWDEMDPASTHLVALVDGRLVGYLRVIDEGGAIHLRQLCVHPDYRQRGIASRLVESALGVARGANATRAYLNARLTAVGLYERLGFRQVGGEFPMARTYLPHVRMEIEL